MSVNEYANTERTQQLNTVFADLYKRGFTNDEIHQELKTYQLQGSTNWEQSISTVMSRYPNVVALQAQLCEAMAKDKLDGFVIAADGEITPFTDAVIPAPVVVAGAQARAGSRGAH